MISWRMVGTEVSALGVATLSMPVGFLVPGDRLDPEATHRTPVMLVHGFLGHATNFLVLQRCLGANGFRNFATFSYLPRLDYQRLAPRLGEAIDALRRATGAAEVDVVGHSLGGLVARYLVELAPAAPVRRLVTLGAPYFANPLPPQELAIFAADDPFIVAPDPAWSPPRGHTGRGGRVLTVPECGHWGLLYHPAVQRAAVEFLAIPGRPAVPSYTLALEAAS